MKRSWCLSLWMSIVACVLLSAPIQPVKAQTPASIPTPTPATPANAKPVDFGTPVTSVSLSKTVPVGGKADFKVDSSQDLNIMKDFEDQGTVERLQYAASALTQKEVLQQYIDPPDPGYVWSGVIRICRSTGGADSTEVTQSRFVTKVDSEKHLLSDLYNVSGKIAAIFPGYSLSKDDTGNYIQAKIPSVINSSYQPPCDTNGTGITAVPKQITLAEGWFASLLRWLFSSTGGGSQTVTATAVGKEVSDGANRFVKLLTGKDVGPVSDLPPDEQPKVSAARGALASLLPGNATFKSDNGQIPNFSVNATVTTPTPAPTPTGTASVQGETTGDAIPVNYPEGYVKDYDTQTLCWATQKGDPRRPPESDCQMTTTNVSGTGGWNCDTSVPEQSVTGLNKAEAQSVVDRWYGTWCQDAKENAWKQCMNDVIKRARDWCVDPIFALAIWIHESGASNYKCSEIRLHGSKVQDFGININSIAENLSEQLNRFVQLPSAYRSGGCPLTLQDFFARFGPGVFISPGHYQCYSQLSTENKAIVDNYINEISGIYAFIAPGVSLPTWPASASCPGH